jgi:hypothetical protein
MMRIKKKIQNESKIENNKEKRKENKQVQLEKNK